jgi:mono/diheme cytochrome c family protein
MEVRDMRSNLSLISALVTSLLANSGAYAQDAGVGATLYVDACSACHGATGLGDGDMADVVTIKAPNLTLLKEKNDGAFPMLDVIHIIDGRTGVRAHGGVMPVWGQVGRGG